MSNVVNSLYNYSLVNPGTPTIIVVLDSNQQDKRISVITMRKLLAKGIQLHAIIISDCTDSETKSLFNEFVNGDQSRIYYVPKSGEALSALLCVVPL